MGLGEVGSRKIRKVFGANSLEMTLLETVYARYATYLMFVRFFVCSRLSTSLENSLQNKFPTERSLRFIMVSLNFVCLVLLE